MTVARKSLSKTVRFEVFKRDKFTCQYCGAQAPEVILEVDHIKPVSKGGTNDIMNLVTACRNCNGGKSNRELSDDSAVKVQKKQLDDLQDRREQLEMMIQWRDGLNEELNIEVEAINCLFAEDTRWDINDSGKDLIRKMIKRFGFNEVYTAAEIAIDRYYYGDEESWNEAFNKIGGICYNRKKAREEDAEQDN